MGATHSVSVPIWVTVRCYPYKCLPVSILLNAAKHIEYQREMKIFHFSLFFMAKHFATSENLRTFAPVKPALNGMSHLGWD